MTEITDNAAPVVTGQPDAGTPAIVAAEAPKTWFDGFADEDRGYILNKGWDKEDGTKNLLTSYKNLEKLRGVPEERLLKLPEKIEDADGWSKVYEKLGRPEKPEGYEFKAPEGVELDAGRMSWAANMAHSIGLNKAQHKALVENTLKYETETQTAFAQKAEQERVTSLAKLNDEWGSAKDERVHLAERGLMHFMDDKSEAAVAKIQQVMGHAEVMKMFAKIGESIGEDKIPSADGDRPFGYSPEQAKSDMQQLNAALAGDRKRLAAYNEGKGEDYEKMQKLLKIATGSR
jgi:hypothetical protein